MTIFARVFGCIAAMLLVFAVAANPVCALLDEVETLRTRIDGLVRLSQNRPLVPQEMKRLFDYTKQLKSRFADTWSNTRSGKLLADDPYVQAWKKGNAAIVDSVSRHAAQSTGSTLGFMPTGKDFTDPDFHPVYSDYDYTVLGRKSEDAVDALLASAPPGFAEEVKLSVMSSEGNLHRYRGTPIPQADDMPEALWEGAKAKYLEMLERAAPRTGAYLSEGAVTALEEKLSSGKYGGQVQFFDSAGASRGHMPIAQMGSMPGAFGDFRMHEGDLLGQAADNHAQLKNYVVEKGPVEGLRKQMQRQTEVLERLRKLDTAGELGGEIARIESARDGLLRQIAKVEKTLQPGVRLADLSDPAVRALMERSDRLSRSVVALSAEQFGREQARLADAGGAGIDAAKRSIARLRAERNLISSIVNVGGVENFRAIVGEGASGGAGIVALTDKLLQGYDTRRIANLAALRQGAIEEAARRAGTSPDAVRKALDSSAEALGLVAGDLKRTGGLLGDFLSSPKGGATVDALLTAYHLSNGNYEAAFNSAAEGALTYAVPAAAVPFIVRDMMGLGMSFLESRIRGPFEEKLSKQTSETFQAWLAESPANLSSLATVLRNATSADDPTLAGDIEALVAGRSFATRLQLQNMETFRQLLFANREAFIEQADYMAEMEAFAKNRAFNLEWQAREIEKAITEDAERARTKRMWVRLEDKRRQAGADKSGLPADTQDSEPAGAQRIWSRQQDDADEPEDGASPDDEEIAKEPDDGRDRQGQTRKSKKTASDKTGLGKGGSPQPPADEPRRIVRITPQAPARPQAAREPGSAVPTTGMPATAKIVPWAQSDPRSVCLGYHKLATRHRLHGQFRNLVAIGEPVWDAQRRVCVVKYTGEFRHPQTGEWLTQDGIEINVDVDKARKALIDLDPDPVLPQSPPRSDIAAARDDRTPVVPADICNACAALMNRYGGVIPGDPNWGGQYFQEAKINSVEWSPYPGQEQKRPLGLCTYNLSGLRRSGGGWKPVTGYKGGWDADYCLQLLRRLDAESATRLDAGLAGHETPPVASGSAKSGGADCAGIRGAPRPSTLNARAMQEWLRCNAIGE